ncbi:MAG: hypothetical protein M0006_15565 [Magnetospirillum sp.]|nr:hypothetical protein [Magnetospirillum sp.]
MPAPHIAIARLAAEGSDLLFQCMDCGASVLAPIEKVLRRFGQGATLADVQAPAVCKHCGSIDVEIRPLPRVAA